MEAAAAQGRSVEVAGGQPTGPGHGESRLPAVQESPASIAAAAPQGVSPVAGQQRDAETASTSAQEPLNNCDKLQHFAGRCACGVCGCLRCAARKARSLMVAAEYLC